MLRRSLAQRLVFLLNKDGILFYHNSQNTLKWFGDPFTFIDSITSDSSKNGEIKIKNNPTTFTIILPKGHHN
ncbi:MAG: hypothetical protein IIB02_01540 [Thaumarchaeota archaeon]|nr:hypothetical protein [Nitrososphaerota archaeon]